MGNVLPPLTSQTVPHRAGQKIRAWREAHGLGAAEFGATYGAPREWPSRTVYGWETHGKIPRPPVVRRLESLGICEAADWMKPAEAVDNAANRAAA